MKIKTTIYNSPVGYVFTDNQATNIGDWEKIDCKIDGKVIKPFSTDYPKMKLMDFEENLEGYYNVTLKMEHYRSYFANLNKTEIFKLKWNLRKFWIHKAWFWALVGPFLLVLFSILNYCSSS